MLCQKASKTKWLPFIFKKSTKHTLIINPSHLQNEGISEHSLRPLPNCKIIFMMSKNPKN